MDCLIEPTAADIPVLPLTSQAFEAWRADTDGRDGAWADAQGFEGQEGRILCLPSEDGGLARVLFGLGNAPNLWTWAHLAGLPEGSYALEGVSDEQGQDATLAFALACYRFDRYKDNPAPKAKLAWPEGVDRGLVTRLAEGACMARDLVNTPAGDLGPAELCDAVRGLAERHGGEYAELAGQELLDENYPTVHAVGRAASRPPRLADLRWGDPSHPKVTLVGKGVIFDSGGLDLKPAEGMKLMKKDMGGAASVIGLAHAIMDGKLPVRLRVLVPAVENAVSGDAFRPGDVIRTRKGLTVEIGNTDAEGRLILCDALAEADTEDPELIVDFATLTGAARIALGTELPALFCSDDTFADQFLEAGLEMQDALWRLPLHADYRRQLDSPVADLNNIGARFGGAITAALFLKEFVSEGQAWAHIDTMAWNEGSRPGRPVGGETFGLRALYRALEKRYA